MGSDKFIQSLIQSSFLREDDLLKAIADQMDPINPRNYDAFIALCKKYNVDESFYMKIYINAPERVQYRLWKDGYVESCPAAFLINDIVSEDKDTSRIIRLDYSEKFQHCEAHFDKIQDVIVNRISKSKKSLKIAMAWFTNPVIFNALWRACKRGIDVQLLINNDLINNRPNGLPFDKLIESGARLYVAEVPSFVHNKFCIIDDKAVIDGSYNWTILAETNNDENIVIVENGVVIHTFIEAFNKLIRRNKLVDHMPDRIAERPEYDCCSYKCYNGHEYLDQIDKTRGKAKQKKLYKEFFRVLPEDYTSHIIPSEIFDAIKKEVEQEKNKDTILLDASLNQQSEQLQKELRKKELRIGSISHKTEILEEKKTKAIDGYKSKVSSIKAKNISQQKKDDLLIELKRTHRSELRRINRTLAKHSSQLGTLREESETLSTQQVFIDSIQDTELKGKNGLCRINLKWNTEDDLDLHLILPNGTIDSDKDIFYHHMSAGYKGGICTLDHDAIPTNAGENPQENIVWENRLPDGTYRVAVKLFNKKSADHIIPFSVTAFCGNYVKTGVFSFNNSRSKDVIEITTLTFKNGKVITPINFNTKNK